MRTKELTIICTTIIIVTMIICGSILYINYTNTDNTTNSTNESTLNNTTTNTSQNNTVDTSTPKDNNQQNTKDSVDTDSDGYIDGKEITFRNKNFLGEDSDLEQFSTSEDMYIKQKSTGKIAKRHLDDDGVYRYYDMQTGEFVLG